MGDSVMAVWGAPARSQTHAFDALSAAMDIERELHALNADCSERGLPAIQLGLGLSTGRANVGPLGSEYRMDYTVVGDTVNVAQRLEAAADVDEITLQALQQHQEAMLASRNGDWARARALFEHLRDGVGPRPMYELYLRGIDQASGQ